MPSNKQEYYIYSHINPAIQTMGDFVSEIDSIGIGLNIKDLLLYRDQNDSLNVDNLINRYTQEEYNSNNTGKFNPLISSLYTQEPVKQITTVDQQTDIENNATDISTIYTPINQLKLQLALNSSDQTYSNFSLGANAFYINELYNESIRLLFKKFKEEI